MTIKNCIKFHLHWAPAIILALVLIVATVTPAHATEIDNDGNIGKSEVIDDDLILNGEIVNMDGTVNGLLIASGQTITINGIVNGDAILLASSVIISEGASIKGNVITFAATTDVIGQIDGSLIGANSAVTFHKGSSVGRNVYFAGFSLKSEPDSVINRDLYSADYQVILNGTIGRNANVAAAAVELSGKIANNANFNVEAPTNSKKPEFFFPGMTPPGAPPPIPTGLRIYESAEIGGQMIYTSPSEQASAIKSAPLGGVVFQTPVPDENGEPQPIEPSGTFNSILPAIGKALLSALRNLITLLILGALVLWLIPSIFQKTVDQAKNRTLPAAGYGVLTVLAGYLGSVLIAGLIVLAGLIVGAITLGGLSRTVFGVGLSSLALIMAVFTLLVSYGSKLVIAFLVGQWVVQKTAPQSKNQKAWALVTGVVIYVILRSIPIFGWLVGVIATVIGVGAMWMLYQNQKPPIPQGAIPPAASEV
jgi:hypothetical protein